MKIRIIDASAMGISLHRKDGDIAEVLWDEAMHAYRDKNGKYEYGSGGRTSSLKFLKKIQPNGLVKGFRLLMKRS